jgi:uncharacterized protein
VRILVAGSSGLIGSALVRVARSDGDEVLRLVRREKAADDEVSWDPSSERGPEPAALAGVDAVVNLAGANIGDHRWTDDYKRELTETRVKSTTLLASTLATLDHKPRVLLSGSAVGYYGETGDAVVDEDSPAGNDFFAELCTQWEAAAQPARDAGIRTVLVRTGVVLSTKGGALAKVLPLFRAGLGGRLGSGKQYMSWIARPDHVAAMRFLLAADDIDGPVNLTAPNPVTNAAYTKAIAAAVRRPAFTFAPALALKLALGELAETVLGGQQVLPNRLLSAGFRFGYDDVERAVRALVDSDS